MNIKVLKKKIVYDGSQLNPDFSYIQGLLDDNVVAFSGPANVKEHLVDLEDSLNNDFIKSKEMLHFIITLQGNNIKEAVLWQRIFIYKIYSFLEPYFLGKVIIVDGDDILIDKKKLSVSIATISPIKELIHIGLNWTAGNGVPVKAFSLKPFLNNYFNKSKLLEIISFQIIDVYNEVNKACFKVKSL